MGKKVAVWFRSDFRLHDHTALVHAIEMAEEINAKIITFFYLDPDTATTEPAHHDYFFQTVLHFKNRLKRMGGDLYIVTGTIEEALESLLQAHPQIEALFVNNDRVGSGAIRDQIAKNYLLAKSIPMYHFEDSYLTEPDQVLKKDGSPYKVFTPYYKAWVSENKRVPKRIEEDMLRACFLKSKPIDEKAEKKFVDLLDKCQRKWSAIGEEQAILRLQTFIEERLSTYSRHRDFPTMIGTSRLSPYLKTGVLSVRSIYNQVIESEANEHSAETYIKELAWRDFYRMVHYYEPKCKEEEIIPDFRKIRWSQDEERLNAWKEGKTGYPIVDAGIRQLKMEGWMHNRLRMITASFLVKDYLLDWRLGERYFEEMLIDYDPSSNVGGWQWAASVGTDAVPYFRVFNPVIQSKRFDESGSYIRKYIPELKSVPEHFIHEPWKMSKEEQQKYKCVIGEHYPEPTIDHSVQRKKAITLFKESKDV
ncbi:deoxyribodipyrimidine photo-lyase [Alkalihalophilus sp. As8PL]|uniref:Deoxyribodipyrimidine photo-lyase n=1 Tax=Alkalihalophilus sp. As8PL TaxID=3237103 RepID=A0AB39BSY4_9BACI